ncbi:MAG: HAMP domain-containing protein [Planctomycetes bacterium]|nr:HAMP domain-containing protein [Planctomycetota bacterium]
MKLAHRITLLLGLVSLAPIALLWALAARSIDDVRERAARESASILVEAERVSLERLTQEAAFGIDAFCEKYHGDVAALKEYYETGGVAAAGLAGGAEDRLYPDRPHPGLPGYGYVHPEHGMYGDFERRGATCAYLRKSVVARTLTDPALRAGIADSLHRAKRLEPAFRALTHKHAGTLDLVWIVLEDGVANVCPPYDLNAMIAKDPTIVDLNESENVYIKYLNPKNNPERRIRWLPPYLDPFKKVWMTSCIAPLYVGERFAGAVGMDLLLATITERIQAKRVGSAGYAFLLDPKGTLLALPERAVADLAWEEPHRACLRELFKPSAEQVWTPEKVEVMTRVGLGAAPQPALAAVAAQMLAQKVGGARVDLPGGETMIAYAPIRTPGWSVGMALPLAEVTAAARRAEETVRGGAAAILGHFTSAFLIVLAVCIGLGMLIGRQITRPVRALIDATRRISAGRRDLPAPPPGRHDEFSEIERSLAEMAALLERDEARIREHAATLEQRVAERTRELEATNQELASFSYSVSHDLRAPLHAVSAIAQFLMEDHSSRLDEAGKEQLRVIRNGIGQMIRLVDDLLALSRLGRKELTREAVDMKTLAETVAAELSQGLGGRRVSIEVRDAPPAYGDPGLLRQVVVNLLANAVKFTLPRSAAIIVFGGRVVDGECVYSVQDNGVGFDMSDAGRLFRPFERLHADPLFEGNGVGLAIVERVARRHGGRAWARSVVDAGAEFFFAVPRGE